MESGNLGRLYQHEETVFRQGQAGECMYVILEGKVEVFLEREGEEVPLKLCREGDFLGEMALFNREVHASSARALGNTRILTVDRKNFLRRIQEDPTIAFRLVEKLSQQIKELNQEVAVLSRAVQDCLGEQLRHAGQERERTT